MRRLFVVLSVVVAAAQQNSSTRIVAEINGRTIILADLDGEIRPQLSQLEEQIRKLRQSMLGKLMDNLLLEQAAKVAGVSLDEYMRLHVEQISVTDKEVEDTYRGTKDRYPGALPSEAKYRIRRSLEDNRRAERFRTILEGLRRTADVRNYLLVEDESTTARLSKDGDPHLFGERAAPITIVAFSDFECPFSRDAYAQLRQTVENSSGKVNLVFRHFPLPSHRCALDAARAGVCAHQQGKFWPLHDRLFGRKSDLSPPGVMAAASEAGVDLERFTDCMRSGDTAERIRLDLEMGQAIAVTGTPALFVNGRRLTNAMELDSAIQDVLRARRADAPPVR